MGEASAVQGTYLATVETTKELRAPPLAVRQGVCLAVVGVVVAVAVVGRCGCSHYLGQKTSAATPPGPYSLAVSVPHNFLLVLHPNGRTVDYMDDIGWNDIGWNDYVESLAHWTDAALATT